MCHMKFQTHCDEPLQNTTAIIWGIEPLQKRCIKRDEVRLSHVQNVEVDQRIFCGPSFF